MKLLFKTVIVLFLLFEIAFSFKRFSYFPIDGDLPAIVLPDKNYKTVLQDPFGLNVLLHDSVYAAPNRFFAHWSLSAYFKEVPLLFQHFVSPIDSIYYACAFAKTVIQFFLIYLLAVYITGRKKVWDFDNLLAASIITPLFQTFGYNFVMGIIDHSITYTFFYAFALCFVLLFFLPFFLMTHYNHKISISTIILLIVPAVVLSFNGPLNQGVTLIVCSFIAVNYFFANFKKSTEPLFVNKIIPSVKNIPHRFIFIFGLVILLCLYSFYIGRNNSENLWESIPLVKRYEKLPMGFYLQFTEKPGLLLTLLMIFINSLIMKKQNSEGSRKLLRLLMWIGIFILIYVLLLPFGGYRSYRPNIIRMDTIMPVTLALIFFYGISTFYIIKNISLKYRPVYYTVVIVLTTVFINADAAVRKYYTCERNALEKISQSSEKIILLETSCPVMSWDKTKDYKDSEVKTELLLHWNIIKERKLFYQN